MKNKSELTGGQTVGNVEMRALADVQKNPWNPNAMSPEMYASLRYGLENDGWLASQALLVWGTDEEGVAQNLIIDGEHRYRVARELGFERGPMVLLKNIPEAKAKALTIAMNQRRGAFNQEGLAALLQAIQYEVPDLSANLGIPHDELLALLETAAVPLDLLADDASGAEPRTEPTSVRPPGEAAEGGSVGAPLPSDVRMVQLFFNTTTHEEFTRIVGALRRRYDTKNVTDTVLAAVREMAGLSAASAA